MLLPILALLAGFAAGCYLTFRFYSRISALGALVAH
mgnify:CR=1 FL=1